MGFGGQHERMRRVYRFLGNGHRTLSKQMALRHEFGGNSRSFGKHRNQSLGFEKVT